MITAHRFVIEVAVAHPPDEYLPRGFSWPRDLPRDPADWTLVQLCSALQAGVIEDRSVESHEQIEPGGNGRGTR